MSLILRSVKGSALSQSEHDTNHKESGYWGTDIASATTTDLNGATGNAVNITGTTTITSFGTAAPIGTIRYVRFTGALTLTHHATNLILPLAANWTTRAGDVMMVTKYNAASSDGWRVMFISRDGDGSALLKYLQFPAIYDNGNAPGATTTIDPANGARQKVTLTGNSTTFTLSAPANSLPMSLQLDIYQDGTGSRTWPAGGPTSSKWKNGADKVLSTAASSRDRLIADYDGSNWICDLMKGIA